MRVCNVLLARCLPGPMGVLGARSVALFLYIPHELAFILSPAKVHCDGFRHGQYSPSALPVSPASQMIRLRPEE